VYVVDRVVISASAFAFAFAFAFTSVDETAVRNASWRFTLFVEGIAPASITSTWLASMLTATEKQYRTTLS